MKRFLFLFAPLLLIFQSAALAGDWSPCVRVIAENRPGYKYAASLGSGVVVQRGADCLVLTAYHVIDEAANAQAVRVRRLDGSEVPATIVSTDPAYDLAVLRPAWPLESTELANTVPQVGDGVAYVGFGGDRFKYRPGRVWGRSRPVDAPMLDWINITPQAVPGDSGSPVFDASGRVCGIVLAAARGSTTACQLGRLVAIVDQAAQPVAQTCIGGRCYPSTPEGAPSGAITPVPATPEPAAPAVDWKTVGLVAVCVLVALFLVVVVFLLSVIRHTIRGGK